MSGDRQPMGVHVAFSAAQLEQLGVPDWMTEDQLAECLDNALLADDTALQQEVQQYVEDHEDRYEQPGEDRQGTYPGDTEGGM